MPIFSETLLRFSFRSVFGKYRIINNLELGMYRKLLLYYYAENYTDVEMLMHIMVGFTSNDIHQVIEESEKVMNEWKTFVEQELMPDALVQTFKLIISEWSQRYKVKYGEISYDLLKSKATELQKVLNYNESFVEKFIKKRRNKLISPMLYPQAKKAKWTDNDLTFKKIITDLLLKISPLLRTKVRKITLNMKDTAEQVEPAKKRMKLAEKVEVQAKPKKQTKTAQKNVKKAVTKILVTENDSSNEEMYEIMEICDSDEEQDITTTAKPPQPPPPPPSSSSLPTTRTTKVAAATAAVDEDDVQFVSKIITLSTAVSYITEVHAFALVNSYNDLSELMQRVMEVLKTKEAD